MINKISKLTVHLLLLAMVTTPSLAFAMDNGNGDPVALDDVTIELSGEAGQKHVVLEWDVVGDAPHGFKVLRSKTNAQLTYPPTADTHADYLGSSKTRFEVYVDAGEHYFRVCAYNNDGGNHGCSNVLALDVQPKDEPVHDDKPEPTDADPVGIDLEAVLTDEGIVLEWEVDGDVSKGQKVLFSKKDPNLTYPPKDGTDSTFVNANNRRHVFKWAPAGYTTYVRVCAYNGDGGNRGCSNVVSVDIPEDYEKDTVDHKKDDKPKMTDYDKEKEHDSEYAELIAEIKALKKQVRELKAAFKDIAQHRYNTAIDYLRENGIVEGYDDGSYKPDNQINRAEFMKIVMEKFYDDVTEEEADCFEDVEREWYAPYVCLGKSKGIVSGYDDGAFRPGQNISFVEAAKILSNVYDLDLDTQGNQWYERYVKALQKDNYVPGSINRLDKPITRAEMAELIWRIREQKKDQEAVELID